MRLIGELRRRKVLKVGAAYLVVAWLAVHAASIGFPAFDAPPWALRVFILVAMLGFPFAVAMAWMFDLTQDGVRRDPGHLSDPVAPAPIAGTAIAAALVIQGKSIASAPRRSAKIAVSSEAA